MPEDGSKRPAPRQRRQRQDLARWIFTMVMTAVVASAATSAMFLAVRPQANPDTFAVQLDRAEAEM